MGYQLFGLQRNQVEFFKLKTNLVGKIKPPYQQGEHVTGRFLRRNQCKSRGIYRYCTNEIDKHFGVAFSEIVRDIVVSVLMDKLF